MDVLRKSYKDFLRRTLLGEIIFLIGTSESRRFLIALIAGVLVIDTFYFLQMAFPNLTSWYIPINWWGLSVWVLIGGFMTGLIVGILALDLRRAVTVGLVSIFLGPIIGYFIAMLAPYFVGSDPTSYNTAYWMLILSFSVSLEACIPTIIGGISGHLLMKNVLRLR
jgi:fructose-specific phosphotransferase system IIC component